MILSAACIAITLVYASFVFFLWNHWRGLKTAPSVSITSPLSVTVLVPFRNEAENLPRLLNYLQAQEFSELIHMEVLLINDHSSDSIEGVLGNDLAPHYRLLINEGEGKKAAIETGVKAAHGDLIITLDADVRIQPHWLQRIAVTYQNDPAALYILPVMLEPSRSVAGQMQELEFSSLMGTTLAMAHSGQPILCNGANLAFEKKAFDQLGGFQLGKKLASGDDLFLLFAVKKSPGMQVKYGAHPDVVAYTPGTDSFRAFLSQRIRWGGKSKHYSDLPALWTAVLVLFQNLVLLLSLILGLIGLWPWYLVLCIWGLKFLPDLIFLAAVTKWFGRQSILWVSPLVLLAYPFYIVFTGLVGLVWKPKWKGRRI